MDDVLVLEFDSINLGGLSDDIAFDNIVFSQQEAPDTPATGFEWTGTVNSQFIQPGNWNSVGVPGAGDTAIFRLGAVPLYPVFLGEVHDPIPDHRTVDRLIIGTNTLTMVGFAGSTLTVDSTSTLENGRGLVIGETATYVAVLNNAMQSLSTQYATLGSAAGSSGTLNLTSASAGDFAVTGTAAAHDLIVGRYGMGTINVANGRDVTVADGTVLGLHAGSTGNVTVSGAGSTWTSGGDLTLGLLVGGSGTGALSISDGGVVSSFVGVIGRSAGGSGTATVTGAGSTWNNSVDVLVGSAGQGSMTISAGAVVSGINGSIAGLTGSDGDVTVTGHGSQWNNTTNLIVGNAGAGALDILAGGYVSNTTGYIGNQSGSTGTVNVDGTFSTWTNSGDLYVGNVGHGELKVVNGGNVESDGDIFISSTGKLEIADYGRVFGRDCRLFGSVSVKGVESLLIIDNVFVDGMVEITARGTVHALQETKIGVTAIGRLRVDGFGSTFTYDRGMYVGLFANGTLEITNGGRVIPSLEQPSPLSTFIGSFPDTIGVVTVDGADSTWSVNRDLYLGYSGSGTIEISNGGRVDAAAYSGNTVVYLGYEGGASGSVVIDGAGSTWCSNCGFNVFSSVVNVGYFGEGKITVTNGGTAQADMFVIGTSGEIRGNGSIVGNVQNGGLMSPGTSAGALSVDGDYAQAVPGRLHIELASAASYDQLLVTGTATFDDVGTLEVALIDGYVPTGGESYTILTAGDLDGAFATELLPSVPNLLFDVIYNPQSVVLAVTSIGVPGDYNNDGSVDAADYVVWRKTDGTQAGYDTWRMHFGETVGSGAGGFGQPTGESSALIPEPATGNMALAGIIATLLYWPHVRNSRAAGANRFMTPFLHGAIYAARLRRAVTQ